MSKWQSISWGDHGDRWNITNGHMSFDITAKYDGSGRKSQYPDGVIVSPEQARQYADKILAALNKEEVSL